MSLDLKKPAPKAMEEAEPTADRSPASVFLIALFALLVFWGMNYLDNHGGGFSEKVYPPYASLKEVDDVQPTDHVDPFKVGQKIFTANCSVCHGPAGLGQTGQFPPLAGSEWVASDSPNRIIRAVLNGLQGPITVKGQPFNNAMVPWKAVLTKDEEVAAVLTFVRQNKEWGNSAPAVTPEQVKAIREKVKDRDNAFSPDELLQIPEGQ
ncbi:MAG: cycA 2 [Pedosphaera sp.]|nr:cycA 2 [Pedosphaera sp.]